MMLSSDRLYLYNLLRLIPASIDDFYWDNYHYDMIYHVSTLIF